MAPRDDFDEHEEGGGRDGSDKGAAASGPGAGAGARVGPPPPLETLARTKEMGLLPIRRRVLLPGGLLRLTIGRPKSVRHTASTLIARPARRPLTEN